VKIWKLGDVETVEMWKLCRYGSFGDVEALEIWKLWRCGSFGDMEALEIWKLWRYGSFVDVEAFEIWKLWRGESPNALVNAEYALKHWPTIRSSHAVGVDLSSAL